MAVNRNTRAPKTTRIADDTTQDVPQTTDAGDAPADTYDPNASRECERMLTDLLGPPVSWRQKEARRYNANLDTAIRPAMPKRYAETRFEDD